MDAIRAIGNLPAAEQEEVAASIVWVAHAQGRTLAPALHQARTCLDGIGALVHLCERASGLLQPAVGVGLTRDAVEAWSELREDQDAAPARAVQDRAFVWVTGDSLDIGASGTAAMPLPGADGPVGALSVFIARPGEPDDLQQAVLHAVAEWIAARLEGLPGTPSGSSTVAGAGRTLRMGELTAALAEAVTSRDVLEAVARHVLPPFGADGLLVYVLEHGQQYPVGAVGYPEDFLRKVSGLPLTANPIASDVLETRTPRFVESKAEGLRRYPSMENFWAATPKNALAFLPLKASGRPIGMCVLGFSNPRSFSDTERALLTALSGLVGQALERARLYDLEHARAQELQRGLLPRELPRLPAAHAAARYLPAGRGEEVGGDWYDLIPLSGDRVALVIGDVMGHGITEAVTMGRLRTAVRTMAFLDMSPDELLGHLNDLVSDLGEDFYATCLYAVFDPVSRTCAYSLAGHPPPVIVHPDGTVLSLDLATDPPLGAAEPPFLTREVHLPNESLLVLCTDGLIESATRDAEQGLAQLRELLAGTAYFGAPHPRDVGSLEDLCDMVTAALLPDREQTNDDAALLITHVRGTSAENVATYDLAHDPRAAGHAREHVRERLADWGLEDLTITTELLVSELVGNVVRHARGPVRLRLLRSRCLICEVYDGSLSTPRIRNAAYTDEGGRGLQLVAALAQRWGARYLQDGKCIWTEQDIPENPPRPPLAQPGAA
ncbi:SpoIIE family protein phosphatase [Streptomyces sp. NPDC096311]|uniref:ATP-binding SpoIIE family protein phosphatase n=1 Tax=Streptomyces sp. NPDC096311 TaxID=3366083 RepID=UPI003806ACC4